MLVVGSIRYTCSDFCIAWHESRSITLYSDSERTSLTSRGVVTLTIVEYFSDLLQQFRLKERIFAIVKLHRYDSIVTIFKSRCR